MNSLDQGKFLLYTAPDGAMKADVFFQNESVWLTQKAPGRTLSRFSSSAPSFFRFFSTRISSMLRTELLELLANRENCGVEFKRDDESWKVRLIEEEFHKRMWAAEGGV